MEMTFKPSLKSTPDRKKWLLLLLNLHGRAGKTGEPIEGTTKLMKELFILTKYLEKHNIDTGFEFAPGRFGPVDGALYPTINELSRDGLIGIIDKVVTPGYETREYRITKLGMDEIKKEVEDMGPLERRILFGVKSRFNQMSLNSILNIVYNEYSSYVTKSEIKDKVLEP